MTEYEFKIYEDETLVASGIGTNEADIQREANHYLMMYWQNGGKIKCEITAHEGG